MPSTIFFKKSAPLSDTARVKEKLAQIQAVMQNQHIDDLAALGNLICPENNVVIPGKGVVTPKSAPDELWGQSFAVSRIRRANTSAADASPLTVSLTGGMARIMKGKPFRLPVTTGLAITDAFWLADEIRIGDNTTVLFTSESKNLTLVANRIVIGRNVQFTWREPDFIKDLKKPAKPAQKTQTKISDHPDEILHGEDGYPASVKDLNGQAGDAAPSVEFWTLDFQGQPVFLFPGQDGQDGGDGGDGGDGQDGARGANGKMQTLFGVYVGCEHGAGSGGNGGRGGNGGNGGRGGNGGKGGKVLVCAPSDVISNMASTGFYVETQGGKGGAGGAGGQGGSGGRGGRIGKTATSHLIGTDIEGPTCGPLPGAREGLDGQNGKTGLRGQKGAEGSYFFDSVRLVAIEEDTFQVQLNKPFIAAVHPTPVKAGETLTLSGASFSSTDILLVDNSRAISPNRIGSKKMTLTWPEMPGGRTQIQLRQKDGTLSNIFTLDVAPHIERVETADAGVALSRYRPGTEIRILGSGFSPAVAVRVNEQLLNDVRFVSSREILAVLTRPFEPGIFPGPEAEFVDLSVEFPAPAIRSNAIRIQLETFKMIVAGDSILWGQGLQEHQKTHALVESELRKRKSNIGFYKVVHAHSGAILGNGSEAPEKPVNGEVPRSGPTVRQQLNAVLSNGRQVDDNVDFILLDGGINDINVAEIMNPFGPDLATETREKCYERMKSTLLTALTQFPNARIVVSGYYQIISSKSDMRFLAFFLAGLGFAVAGLLGATTGLVLDQAAIAKIVERCREFKTLGHARLKKAIAEANANLPEPRVFFADPEFAEGNAAFAPQSFLFGIEADLSPTDNPAVAQARAAVCEILEDGAGEFKCKVASIGHPNPEGAIRYAEAILSHFA